MIQLDDYDGSCHITCPICATDYSHIREVSCCLGSDPHEGGGYAGVVVQGRLTDERRAALCIFFEGECGHAWEMRIQQHEGINEISFRTKA